MSDVTIASSGKPLRRLLIVTGEASGDLHAARVLDELKRRHPGLEAFGIGGRALIDHVGMRQVGHIRELSIMGFSETLSALPRVLALKKRVVNAAKETPPDCALLVDSADFNLRLAADLKKLGIPVAFYIAPKLWASRASRARLLVERVDRLGVIFPFEVDFLAKLGVKATYVGNPTVDGLAAMLERAPPLPACTGSGPLIAMLPGSRPHEVRRHGPALAGAIALIRTKHAGARFLVPKASTIDAAELAHLSAAGAEVVEEPAPLVVRRCDVAVVAAGTATLETALMGIPQTCVFRVGFLTSIIWRFILRTPWVSLPNILAQKEVLKELFQDGVTPQAISDEVCALLTPGRRARMTAEYDALRGPLGAPGAPARMADVIEEVVGVSPRKAAFPSTAPDAAVAAAAPTS